MMIYPALDLLDGRVVRLIRGDFATPHVYSDDPAAVLASFRAAGATVAHVVDLNGARDPIARQKKLLSALFQNSGLKIQVGGGIRSRADALELLQWGADRVVLGSIAVTNPTLGEELITELSPKRVTLAVDVTIGPDQVPCAAIRGWTEKTKIQLEDLIGHFCALDLRHVLCTDIGRDGVAQGPNVALYKGLVERFAKMEVQASGGVRNIQDLQALRAAGAPAVIIGTALYKGTIDLSSALKEC